MPGGEVVGVIGAGRALDSGRAAPSVRALERGPAQTVRLLLCGAAGGRPAARLPPLRSRSCVHRLVTDRGVVRGGECVHSLREIVPYDASADTRGNTIYIYDLRSQPALRTQPRVGVAFEAGGNLHLPLKSWYVFASGEQVANWPEGHFQLLQETPLGKSVPLWGQLMSTGRSRTHRCGQRGCFTGAKTDRTERR
jgi:hypothetical protein